MDMTARHGLAEADDWTRTREVATLGQGPACWRRSLPARTCSRSLALRGRRRASSATASTRCAPGRRSASWAGRRRCGDAARSAPRDRREPDPGGAWVDTWTMRCELIGRPRVRGFSDCSARAPSEPSCPPALAGTAARCARWRWPRTGRSCWTSSGWLQAHPRPGIYLRQVDVPGVHSKFIEAAARRTCRDAGPALPAEPSTIPSGAAEFARRYGFRAKPAQRFGSAAHDLRCRCTGRAIAPNELGPAGAAGQRGFITENEINSWPSRCAPSLVVFGAGSGFDHLAQIPWLSDMQVALLGRHRHPRVRDPRPVPRQVPARRVAPDGPRDVARAPGAVMTEPSPTQRDLPRLNEAEAAGSMTT